MMARRQVKVMISGRVQGVWYRAWATEEASELGLDGWVRNRRDGCVEAVFAGTPDDIDKMLELCRQGPPLSKVDDVAYSEDKSSVDPGFKQLPTA